MKNLILAGLALFCFHNFSAQDFAWTAQGLYMNLSTAAGEPVTDHDGNIYVIGQCYFDGKGVPPDSSRGSFLNKYSPEGRLIWSRLSREDDPRIAINHNLQEILITSWGENGYDLSKYDFEGILKSRTKMIEMNGDKLPGAIRGVSVDENNNCYMVGVFRNSTINIQGYIITNNSNDETHLFFLKLDAQEKLVWIKSSNSGHIFNYTGIKTDKNGHSYIYGAFIGELELAGHNYLSENTNGFVTRINNDGTFQWLINFGAKSEDHVSSVTIDYSQNTIKVIGYHSSSFEIGPWKAEVKGVNDGNIFIAELSGSGTVQKLKSFGGLKVDAPGAIYSNAESDIFFTGGFQNTTTLDGLSYTTEANGFEPYIAKCDKELNIIWLTKTGASETTEAYAGGLTGDLKGNLIFTGQLQGKLNFNGHSQESGGKAMYVAKVTDLNPLGLHKEVLQTNDIIVYPVPSTGAFRVSYTTSRQSDVVIEVRDEAGKLIEKIKEKNINGVYSKEIFLPGGSAGTYYVSLTVDEKKVAKKQIIK